MKYGKVMQILNCPKDLLSGNFKLENWLKAMNDTVKDFIQKSKLKECNMSMSYPEYLLKWLLLKGLSPENKIKVRYKCLR